MLRYLLRRTLGWVGLIVLATNLTYFLAWGFLDPKSTYLADMRNPKSPEQLHQILVSKNLSDQVSILDRWREWAQGILLHWDWGQSPKGGEVGSEVSYRIWVSFELVLGATIIMTVLGIALGVYTASRQYKLSDRVGQATSIITMNIPIVVAAAGVVAFALWINDVAGRRIFFVTGSGSPNVEGLLPKLVDVGQHLFLPTVALVLVGYAQTHFLQRSLLLDNINADYVRTARAKGLPKSKAVRKHALRTSLIPVATQVAFSIPAIFTGAILTETIFNWHGMGEYFVETIGENNIHGVVAVAAFGALMTAIGAVLADIALVVIDPRVRVA